MKNRTFTCIICPNGCTIDTEYEDNGEVIVKKISGNKCKRGEEYVVQELVNPKRTIATSVKISNAELPLCSVRVTPAIPKRLIFAAMEQINQVHLEAPVRIGQVVIHDLLGTGSDVIVTKNLDRVALPPDKEGENNL